MNAQDNQLGILLQFLDILKKLLVKYCYSVLCDSWNIVFWLGCGDKFWHVLIILFQNGTSNHSPMALK